MTPALYGAVADSLTVASRIAGVNPAFASRTVLLAIPGATPEVVDAYLAQRNDALAARQPPPVFPVPGVLGAQVGVWRIRAEVTMADGTTYVREAIVRPGADPAHPLTVLAWQEGNQRLLAEPVAR
jgi:general secretion pathway protein K